MRSLSSPMIPLCTIVNINISQCHYIKHRLQAKQLPHLKQQLLLKKMRQWLTIVDDTKEDRRVFENNRHKKVN